MKSNLFSVKQTEGIYIISSTLKESALTMAYVTDPTCLNYDT